MTTNRNWRDDGPLWPDWKCSEKTLAAFTQFADHGKEDLLRVEGSYFLGNYARLLPKLIEEGKRLELPRYKVREVLLPRFWNVYCPEYFLTLLAEFYSCGCLKPCKCPSPDDVKLKDIQKSLLNFEKSDIGIRLASACFAKFKAHSAKLGGH